MTVVGSSGETTKEFLTTLNVEADLVSETCDVQSLKVVSYQHDVVNIKVQQDKCDYKQNTRSS